MANRNIILLSVLILLAACRNDDPAAANEAPAIDPDDTPPSVNLPPAVLNMQPRGRLPSGAWLELNGARICDGYMTRLESEDYCAATVPEDWRPFEFDGQTYFVQPLAGESR